MAKWIFLGLIFFFYFIAPPLFRVMIKSDANNLQNGLRESKRVELESSRPPTEIEKFRYDTIKEFGY